MTDTLSVAVYLIGLALLDSVCAAGISHECLAKPADETLLVDHSSRVGSALLGSEAGLGAVSALARQLGHNCGGEEDSSIRGHSVGDSFETGELKAPRVGWVLGGERGEGEGCRLSEDDITDGNPFEEGVGAETHNHREFPTGRVDEHPFEAGGVGGRAGLEAGQLSDGGDSFGGALPAGEGVGVRECAVAVIALQEEAVQAEYAHPEVLPGCGQIVQPDAVPGVVFVDDERDNGRLGVAARPRPDEEIHSELTVDSESGSC